MSRRKDFLEELIEERTARNPDFPKMFDEAWQERLARQEESPRRAAIDILTEAPQHRLFEDAAEVDAFLQRERDSWDR